MTSTTRTGTKGVARPEREAQIIDVAGQTFAELGYAAASVVDIAEAAGISKPLIYNYFGSKDGLYEACIRHAADLVVGEVERTASSGAVGVERGVVTIEGLFRLVKDTPWAWPILTVGLVNPPTPEVAALLDSSHKRLSEIAADGVGEFMALAGATDPLDIEAMIAVWMSAVDALMRWAITRPELSSDDLTERTERMFATLFAG